MKKIIISICSFKDEGQSCNLHFIVTHLLGSTEWWARSRVLKEGPREKKWGWGYQTNLCLSSDWPLHFQEAERVQGPSCIYLQWVRMEWEVSYTFKIILLNTYALFVKIEKILQIQSFKGNIAGPTNIKILQFYPIKFNYMMLFCNIIPKMIEYSYKMFLNFNIFT